MPPLLPFSAAGAVASSSTLAGVAGGVVGSPSGVACGACKQQMAEGSDSSASGPVAHVSEQQSGLLEGTRRGLEEAERSRAAELVQVKGELQTVRGEVVTVRGGLLTTRGELATMKGELDLLKGTLLETRKDLAEQNECLQKVETEKLASEEEEVKELGKGMISNDAAAVPSPALKHVEFDVEEELRMRQGAYKTVWQRIHATTTLDLKGLPYLSEAILAHVSTMTHLKHITLDATEFSPDGIKHLYMKQLESLELASSDITDSCLEGIGAAISLKSLYLKGTRVSDADLQFLAPLSRLRVLVLPRTITALEGLDISNCYLTGMGVALLRKLPRLRLIRAEGRNLHALVLSNLPGVELSSAALK